MIISSKQLWFLLYQRIAAQGNPDKTYNNLVARYSEPHRAYHTLGHIEHCLDELGQARHLAINLNAVELALWFHDAIYDTKAKDNEEKSAALAVDFLKNASLPEILGRSVANLIMATKHTAIPADPDNQLLVDIDLSILGQSEGKFDEYERQIRKEYEWVSEDAFIVGRLVILKSFLDRQVIYSTRFFREKYEARAQWNIARSFKKLSDSAM